MKKIWNQELWMTLLFLTGCFFLGLTGGVLFANLTNPYRSSQGQIRGLYTWMKIKDNPTGSVEFLCYLSEIRLFAIFFFLLIGMTSAARFITVAAVSWMGFLAGAAAGVLLLEQGLRGLGIFLAAMFPQAIGYLPGIMLLTAKVYKERGNIWKKPIRVVKEYFIVAAMGILCCMAGVLMEAYINPLWMNWILK